MVGRANEGSPLLGGAADPARGRGDADRKGSSGLGLLRELRHKSKRPAVRLQAAPRAFLQRHWRLSAGVAGVLIIPMALAGLVAIFSAVKGQTSPGTNNSNPLRMKEAGVSEEATEAAASESRERCERGETLAIG